MILAKKIILVSLAAAAIAAVAWYFSPLSPPAISPNPSAANGDVAVRDPAKPDQETATTTPQQFVPSSNPPPAQPPLPKPDTEPCTGSDRTNFDCYEGYYRTLVGSAGVPATFADLQARYPNNDYIRAQCHPLTHILGQAATEKYPTVAEAFTHGDSFCWSGYYHGVMEGSISKIGRSELPDQLNSICANVEGRERYSFDYFNCVHGLGHGVMAYTNIELFDSLALCDRLEGSWERSSCYGGVYMENVIVDNKNHFTKYLKPDDPLYPCNAVDDKYKNDCYLMQTSYMLKVLNGSFAKVFEECATVSEAGWRYTCFQSLGRDASGRSTSNAQQTAATCDLGTSYEQRSNCIIGAVKDFISYFHSDKPGYALCDILSPDLQQICRDTTKAYYAAL